MNISVNVLREIRTEIRRAADPLFKSKKISKTNEIWLWYKVNEIGKYSDQLWWAADNNFNEVIEILGISMIADWNFRDRPSGNLNWLPSLRQERNFAAMRDIVVSAKQVELIEPVSCHIRDINISVVNSPLKPCERCKKQCVDVIDLLCVRCEEYAATLSNPVIQGAS